MLDSLKTNLKVKSIYNVNRAQIKKGTKRKKGG